MMPESMLKKTPQTLGSTAQERANMESAHAENLKPSLAKGKGKAPSPKSGSTSNAKRKTCHTHGPAPLKGNTEMASMSTCGVKPAGPSPATFNAKAIAILREMHRNQNKTNEKVETLALKVGV